MSKFVLYVNLPKYLHEWATHQLGDPVTFPQYSNENAVIRSFLQKLPAGVSPDVRTDGATAVAIPDSASKPIEYYNYMGDRGKLAVVEVIKDLFTRALWNDINQLEKSPVGLNQLIAAWCEMHGIGLDRVETVRQRYYRIRKAYYKHGINLKKSSRQHNHDSVDFQVSETESNNHTQQ